MAYANSGLKWLTERPLLIPEYLHGPVETLTLLAEPLAEVVSEFLRLPVSALIPEVQRQPTSVYDPAAGPGFDCHFIMGDLSMRLIVPNDSVDLMAPILFGGPLKEAILRATIAQGVATKVAGTVLTETGQSMAAPSLKAATDVPLSSYPLLNITYRFDLGTHGELPVTIGFTRAFTDTMSPPTTDIPESVVLSTSFEATAIAAEQQFPVKYIDSWASGTVISLKRASTDRITLVAFSKTSKTPFAMGEMGEEDGTRSVRLTLVGAEAMGEIAPLPSSGFGAGASLSSATEPEITMDFAMANPLEDNDDDDASDDFPKMKSAFDD